MKAAVVTEKGVQVTDAPKPAPKPNEIRIKVRAASLNRARGLNGRTVLGDFADNPGGGAPGDSTFFLKALIDRFDELGGSGPVLDLLGQRSIVHGRRLSGAAGQRRR